MRKPPTLTDEQRQARRETIMRTKPWTKATGPKTVAGKAASAKRWQRHGLRSEEAKAAQQWVSSIRSLLRVLAKHRVICFIFVIFAVTIPANFYQV
ncbi:hypothetical protein [Rugamonas sp.]|uniref:hypothetical protein n=1 Tax=Rugamonas sp. TaxID=1926287 RepID=UPI0025E34414|nr:hypothetical protein [Rugamonas sp.]